jgi:outer membrane lipoprotein carrier protein
MKRILYCLGMVFGMAWGAAPVSAQTAQHQLETFVSTVNAASGSFTQTMTDAKSQTAQQSSQSGVFSFQRPGKFKWAVQKPYEQFMVSNGQQVYQYDPDLAQVTVRKVDQVIGASPAAILFGSNSLAQSFEVSPLPEQAGIAWLRAKPRHQDTGFAGMDIGFKDNLPVCLELLDAFGQKTRVELSNFTLNPALRDQDFQFTPPAGVEVVKM